ncbi:MAG: zf-HC2 domain-containing protein [Acidobacteriota bacterium]
MNCETIEARNIVELYVLKRLTPEEADRFEEHYFECSECLEKLEQTLILKQGLREIAGQEGARLMGTSLLGWLAGRGRWMSTVVAAAIVAAVALPWLVLGPRVSRLAGELDQVTQPRAELLATTLSPVRSGAAAEPSVRITLGPEPRWLALELELPPPAFGASQADASTHRVRLSSESGVRWQDDAVASDASGRIRLTLHSTWLQAADYLVEVEPLEGSSSEAVTRFTFRVRTDS